MGGAAKSCGVGCQLPVFSANSGPVATASGSGFEQPARRPIVTKINVNLIMCAGNLNIPGSGFVETNFR
jgi:hypothetical protein